MASRGTDDEPVEPPPANVRTLPHRTGRPSDLRDIHRQPKQEVGIAKKQRRKARSGKGVVEPPKLGSQGLTLEEVEKAADDRKLHKLKTKGDPKHSSGNPGFKTLERVSFYPEPGVQKPKVSIRAGDWVLASVERVDKGEVVVTDYDVAYVGEILQDEYGEVLLGVRWSWKWQSMFPGATGRAALQNENRIVLQQNLCEDGVYYVTDENGKWSDTLPWGAVISRANVLHSSEVQDTRSFGKRSRNTFFYDKQFDHTIWRLSDVHNINKESKPLPPMQLKEEELTMMDVFSGLGTVALAAKAAGFKPLWAVELDKFAFNSCMFNLHGTLKIQTAQSLARFIEGIKKGRPGYPTQGQVGLLHLSPPCQTLSQANRHTDISRIEEALLGKGALIDQCVEIIQLLRPKFVTVEEVPDFLAKTVLKDYKAGKVSGSETVRPIIHFLAPLIDIGYQVEICVLNSVFYGVPQVRKRLVIFLALPGYALPSAPPAQYFYPSVANCMKFSKTDPMRRDCLNWRSIYVTPRGYSTSSSKGQPDAEQKAEALTVEEAEKIQIEEAIAADAMEAEEDPASLAQGAAYSSAENPRNLPPAVVAGEALHDIPLFCMPCHNDANGIREFAVDYRPEQPNSRFAEYMRQPCCGSWRVTMLLDHMIRTVEASTDEEGNKKWGTCLRTFMAALKGLRKRKTLATEPYGTICTQRDKKNPRGNLHHATDRLLTLAERRRIQSIPDDVRVMGPLREAERQVGNVVPYLLARAMMDAVMEKACGRKLNPVPILSGFSGSTPGALEVGPEIRPPVVNAAEQPVDVRAVNGLEASASTELQDPVLQETRNGPSQGIWKGLDPAETGWDDSARTPPRQEPFVETQHPGLALLSTALKKRKALADGSEGTAEAHLERRSPPAKAAKLSEGQETATEPGRCRGGAGDAEQSLPAATESSCQIIASGSRRSRASEDGPSQPMRDVPPAKVLFTGSSPAKPSQRAKSAVPPAEIPCGTSNNEKVVPRRSIRESNSESLEVLSGRGAREDRALTERNQFPSSADCEMGSVEQIEPKAEVQSPSAGGSVQIVAETARAKHCTAAHVSDLPGKKRRRPVLRRDRHRSHVAREGRRTHDHVIDLCSDSEPSSHNRARDYRDDCEADSVVIEID